MKSKGKEKMFNYIVYFVFLDQLLPGDTRFLDLALTAIVFATK